MIDPDETARLWPLVDRDAILGAYHVPTDGLAKAVRVSEAQARRATEGGARFLGQHTVTGIRTDDGRVRAVVTDQGEIEADIVVCAAGIWGPLIGAMVGMTVPLQPLAHQYTTTDAASARWRRSRSRPTARTSTRSSASRTATCTSASTSTG